jgi:hypothetical protein
MDGPFVETKELIAGYVIVSAQWLDEATAHLSNLVLPLTFTKATLGFLAAGAAAIDPGASPIPSDSSVVRGEGLTRV